MMEKIIGTIAGAFAIIGVIVALGMLSGTVFYFVYNPIAPKWLYFIPEQLQVIGFWESIALFICTGLIGQLIQKLTPTFIKVNTD